MQSSYEAQQQAEKEQRIQAVFEWLRFNQAAWEALGGFLAASEQATQLPADTVNIEPIAHRLVADIFGINRYDPEAFTIAHPFIADARVAPGEAPLLYVVGLYRQFREVLTDFSISGGPFVSYEEIPADHPTFFAFLLFLLQGMLQVLEPHLRYFVLFNSIQLRHEAIRRQFAIRRYDQFHAITEQFIRQLFRDAEKFILADAYLRFGLITTQINSYILVPSMDALWQQLKADLGETMIRLERDRDLIRQQLETAKTGVPLERVQLEDRLARDHADIDVEAGKRDTLFMQTITPLPPELKESTPTFKLKRTEREAHNWNRLVSQAVIDTLCIRQGETWQEVLDHAVFEYEWNWENGREYRTTEPPLRPVLYLDIEEKVYYIEAEEGLLYCTLDFDTWHQHRSAPAKRPYHGRVDKLRRFTIPDERNQ